MALLYTREGTEWFGRKALLNTIVRAGDALREFQEKAELSKGFRSGFISPTLACLDEKFRIVNRKTIDTLNFILESNTIDNSLSNYVSNVSTIDQLVNELSIPTCF